MAGGPRGRRTTALAVLVAFAVAAAPGHDVRAAKGGLRQRVRDIGGVIDMSARTGLEIARLRLRPKREPLTAPHQSLIGKTALVTGGSAGIGKATAKELARKGARVLILSRNAGRGEDARKEIEAEVPGARIEVVEADLADGASVDRAVAGLKARGERLDVLINNAGGASIRRTDANGVEGTFAGNYLGHARLTLGLLDVLDPDSRIVNITSALHRHSKADVDAFANPPKYSAARAYADSKLALIYMTEQLSRRGVSFAVDPGPVKTSFLSASATPFARSIDVLRRGLGDLYRSPEVAAQDIVGLVTNAHKISLSGQYLEGNRPGRPGAAAANGARSARLWRTTLDLLGIEEDPLHPLPSPADPTVLAHRRALVDATRTPLDERQIADATLTPEEHQPKLDGIRPKLFVRDEAGNRYVLKRDNFGAFGGPHEQRFATALLRSRGEPTIPTVNVRVTVDGKPVRGSVTPFLPNQGPLGPDPHTWTPMQHADVLRTAVWGHWLRNRDLHAGQFLVVDTGQSQGAVAIDWEMAGRWRKGKGGAKHEGAPPSRHELMHPVAPPTAESSLLRAYVRDKDFAVRLDPMIAAAREIESLSEDEIRRALIDSGLHRAFTRGKGYGRFKTMDAFVASLMKDKQGLAARYEAYVGDLAQERATSNTNPRQLGRVAKDVHLQALDKLWGSKLGQKIVLTAQAGLLRGEHLRNKVRGERPGATETLAMGPAYREQLLDRLDGGEAYDLVIIGGGITGANALLEAQSRGLKVLLVEANDFASGTSSRSTKLIHGGLRSLQQHRVGELREALRERGRLRNRTAPHLVSPEPFVIPAEGRKEQVKLGLGVMVLNALDLGHGSKLGHPLGKRGMAKWAPSLDPEAYDKGVLFYDAKTDDARLTNTTIRTAVEGGADALSYAPVVGLERDAGGRYAGVVLEEAETGRKIPVRARHIVSAAGPWTEAVDALAGGDVKSKIKRGSKGSHITLAGDAMPLPAGIIAKTKDGGVVILHRMGDGDPTINVGASKADHTGAPGAVGVTAAEAEELLAQANAVMRPGAQLSMTQVMSGQSAERPALIEEVNGRKAKNGEDRRHNVFTDRSAQGFTSIAGGKLTTASQMAEDVITAVFAHDPALRDRARTTVRGKQRLLGAQTAKERKRLAPELAARHGLPRAQIDHLLGRYGGEAALVLDLITEDRALAQPLPGAPDTLLAEIAFAVDYEGARKIEDVLDRRTRVTLQTFHRGRESARAVADLMGQRLGWDTARTARALDDFEAFVQRESGALPMN